eukprot:s2498_g2.t1
MLLRAWVLTAARCAGSCSYIVFGVMLNGRSIEARRMSDALAGLGFDGCAMRWLVFVHCMRCFSFSTVGIEARRMSDALAGLGVAAARCAGSCSDMVFTKVFIMLILLFAGQRCSGANAPGLYTVRRRFRRGFPQPPEQGGYAQELHQVPGVCAAFKGWPHFPQVFGARTCLAIHLRQTPVRDSAV